ncbi:hypothetical protein [Demequina aurantiaca]|uniref:hypothetical protein n=1 Tax=Demequina aurantiaca TaxID=676200 RepID=UPI003D334212
MNSEQWNVQFKDDREAPSRPPADEALRLWQKHEVENERIAIRERPVDPAANWSGDWWSKPAWALTTSSRDLHGLGPAGLWLVEDGLGWDEAYSELVDHENAPRVYEITTADSWAKLCREYPLDVTASRRHDWYRTTGRDGRWVIPNWARVSPDFDAVHLSVAAYLSLAGISIDVDGTSASVIAGWNPDETYWLTDVSSEPATRTTWMRDDGATQWRRS